MKVLSEKVFFAGRLAHQLSRIFFFSLFSNNFQRCLCCGKLWLKSDFLKLDPYMRVNLTKKINLPDVKEKLIELFCSPAAKVPNLQSWPGRGFTPGKVWDVYHSALEGVKTPKKLTGAGVKCIMCINTIPVTTRNLKIGQRANPELWPIL